MAEDRLQLQRFELKYIIQEETALAIRNFISSHLEIDEFGATRPNLSYAVHSLYRTPDAAEFAAQQALAHRKVARDAADVQRRAGGAGTDPGATVGHLVQ